MPHALSPSLLSSLFYTQGAQGGEGHPWDSGQMTRTISLFRDHQSPGGSCAKPHFGFHVCHIGAQSPHSHQVLVPGLDI